MSLIQGTVKKYHAVHGSHDKTGKFICYAYNNKPQRVKGWKYQDWLPLLISNCIFH